MATGPAPCGPDHLGRCGCRRFRGPRIFAGPGAARRSRAFVHRVRRAGRGAGRTGAGSERPGDSRGSAYTTRPSEVLRCLSTDSVRFCRSTSCAVPGCGCWSRSRGSERWSARGMPQRVVDRLRGHVRYSHPKGALRSWLHVASLTTFSQFRWPISRAVSRLPTKSGLSLALSAIADAGGVRKWKSRVLEETVTR